MYVSEEKTKIGVAPCAWGIWYPEHEQQLSYKQYIEEVALLGVSWTELGPIGYLGKSSDDVSILLQNQGLMLCAGCCAYPFILFNNINEQKKFFGIVRQTAEILKKNGARYFVIMDDSGYYNKNQMDEIKKNHWTQSKYILTKLYNELHEEGIQLLFHPHAGTCVETENEIETFFDVTNGDIHLCFDIAHHIYAGGDVCHFFKKYRSQIDYLHIKNIDMASKKKLEREGLGVEDIFLRGVACDLSDGNIDIKKFKKLLVETSYKGFIIFEQDRFGLDKHSMLSAAQKNIHYWMEQ